MHVDGRLIGNTPQMSLRLSPCKHTVLLVNPEFDIFNEEWIRWFPGDAPGGQCTLLPSQQRRAHREPRRLQHARDRACDPDKLTSRGASRTLRPCPPP